MPIGPHGLALQAVLGGFVLKLGRIGTRRPRGGGGGVQAGGEEESKTAAGPKRFQFCLAGIQDQMWRRGTHPTDCGCADDAAHGDGSGVEEGGGGGVDHGGHHGGGEPGRGGG